jgi:hypothetical protein
MSRGRHSFGYKPPSDGHKGISDLSDRGLKYPMVYCPKIKDTVSAGYTTAGMRCSHCKKIYG